LQLVEDDSTSFAPNNEGIVKIKRDLIYPETVTYQVIVRNLINGCIDTASVPVRFSARPDLEEPSILTYCFGEQFTFKPVFTNAKPNELVYSWYRKPNNLDTLSKDSVFSQTVDSALVAKGLEQIYVLNTRFTDSLGGCIANPTELKIRYGRNIMPKIDLDSALRNASITPAEFTFGNSSKFMPTKSNARFDWNFGQVITPVRTVTGLDAQSTVYSDPGAYNVRLTAYDTLYATTVQVGKICQNTDSMEINVQNLIPSLVTSNGDGVNDNFYIEGMRPNTFSMKLYNRWGKLVGEQDPFEINGWDPKAVAPGTYYYILTERRSGKTLVSWLNISRQ
jgi:gliding motility-associated-like protein